MQSVCRNDRIYVLQQRRSTRCLRSKLSTRNLQAQVIRITAPAPPGSSLPAARMSRKPPQFPYRYAAYLKEHFPAVWAAGGNIRGNDAFRWWSQYRLGVRSPQVMYWWKTTRPAWIARHYGDYRLPGVIAQIKWGTVGKLGVVGMKRVVEDAIRKRYA